MKSINFIFMMTLIFGTFRLNFVHAKPLKLDLESSRLTYGDRTFRFKKGSFEVKKGQVRSGSVVLDVRGAPFIDSDRFPEATFTLQRFEEIHSFAPGAPNLAVFGVLKINGKPYRVGTRLNYQPGKQGFQADGKAEFGMKNTLLHGEVTIKIVAKAP